MIWDKYDSLFHEKVQRCRCSVEFLESIKRGKFLDYLSNCEAPRSGQVKSILTLPFEKLVAGIDSEVSGLMPRILLQMTPHWPNCAIQPLYPPG
jgi:hypothetical protein